MNIINEMQVEKLRVKQYKTRSDMGKASAYEMTIVLKQLLKEKDEVNIIFAAAPSQNEFLGALVNTKGIEWNRVNAFHMDEYIGLDEKAPQGFGNFLRDRIFNKVEFKSIYYLNGNANNIEEECNRYADLLKQYPVDIACMGIGENGHIAFNDPHVALFKDTKLVKLVELDKKSRGQQVNDGCFNKLSDVPTHAMTLTIPALVSAKYIFCMVPDKAKAEAVAKTIKGNVDESCPASILKTHDHAILYIEKDSAAAILD
ncbi:MAG: glucosamine-6-phosphate deaminase [Clostridia bacterium]